MEKYRFTVPEQKRVRMIINTDAKNEADDQFAIVHHLMTPKFVVRGIIAAHFEDKHPGSDYGTMQRSYDEVVKLLDLMELTSEYGDKLYKGANVPMPAENTLVFSEGAQFIIDEAMKDDPRPLYVAFLGTLTDMAAALMVEPQVAEHCTCIWIGGGAYPEGGGEFNLSRDIHAANIVFGSKIPVWQVPKNAYKQMNVSLAELQDRVAPVGVIGKYLFDQMVELNNERANQPWPHGESWCLGDSPTVTVLLEEHERVNYHLVPAPVVEEKTMRYLPRENAKLIRVYHTIDVRLTMEDFYSKLKLNYGDQ